MRIGMSKINILGPITGDKTKLTHNLLNLVQGRIVTIQQELETIDNDIQKFQTKYHMSNDDFLAGWNNGDLGDDEDFFVWEGSLKMIPELTEEMNLLREVL